MNKNSKYFFWLFTGFVLVILVLPTLLKQGMFMDGLLYSTVANNFAHGKGSFWHLYNTATLHTGFYEQPPLYFWIMAGFYKIFGDSIFVERFYDFIMLILSAFLIHKNWQIVFFEKRSYSFLPVLFWITIPVCFWDYSNNMLEISVSVFALASSLFVFKYYFQSQKIGYLIVAGFFLIAGGLTKGFVALFPLTIPFFYVLFGTRFSFKKWIGHSFLLGLLPVLVIGLIFSFEDSRSGFTTYLTQRVFNSISNVATVDSRFHIMWRLAMELLPLVLLNGLIFGIRYFTGKKDKLVLDWKFWLFLSIALSASVPLMVTKEQRGFYLVNSLPFYAMAIAWAFIPMWQKMIDFLSDVNWIKKQGAMVGVVLVVFSLVFSFSQIGKYSRDEAILKDIEVLKPLLKNENLISIEKKMWPRWNLHSYFMRFTGVSLDKEAKHRFLLTKKNNKVNDTTYTKLKINTTAFDLYEKNRTQVIKK